LEYGFLTVRHRPHAPPPARLPELPKAQPSASINPASIRSRQSEETNRGQSSASAVSPPRQSHSGLPRAGFMTFRIWFCLTNPKSWQATAISSCRETNFLLLPAWPRVRFPLVASVRRWRASSR
jgi:hypothetical protein